MLRSAGFRKRMFKPICKVAARSRGAAQKLTSKSIHKDHTENLSGESSEQGCVHDQTNTDAPNDSQYITIGRLGGKFNVDDLMCFALLNLHFKCTATPLFYFDDDATLTGGMPTCSAQQGYDAYAVHEILGNAVAYDDAASQNTDMVCESGHGNYHVEAEKTTVGKKKGEFEFCLSSDSKGVTCCVEVCVVACLPGSNFDINVYPSNSLPHEMGGTKKGSSMEKDTETTAKSSCEAKFYQTHVVGDSVDFYGMYCMVTEVASGVSDAAKDDERSKERYSRSHCGVRTERDSGTADTVAFPLFDESTTKCYVTHCYSLQKDTTFPFGSDFCEPRQCVEECMQNIVKSHDKSGTVEHQVTEAPAKTPR